ncbi:hypothetical protein F5880DRAFT_1512059 [Lentinula raphanica]|nr:hypothetical protein F5880DRAFT_1512059 [Lentinula raphanica]
MAFPQAMTVMGSYLPTSSLSPPRMSFNDGCSQVSTSPPSDLCQTPPTTKLTRRGGLSLPMPYPLPPRTFHESNLIQLEETSSLPYVELLNNTQAKAKTINLTVLQADKTRIIKFPGPEGIVKSGEDNGDDEDYVEGNNGGVAGAIEVVEGVGLGEVELVEVVGEVELGGGRELRCSGQKSRSGLASDRLDEPGISGVASRANSEDPGTEDSSGAGAGSFSNKSFVYSPNRAAPPREVQQESTLLLLTLSSSPDSMDWVEEFVEAIKGEPWAEHDALTSDSLKNLAFRCSRSKNMDMFTTFCRMLNELMFTAKVNSIIHAQQRAFPSKTPSIKGIVNTLKQEGFSKRDLGTWMRMSSGTHWARIAGAETFLLLLGKGSVFCHFGRGLPPDEISLKQRTVSFQLRVFSRSGNLFCDPQVQVYLDLQASSSLCPEGPLSDKEMEDVISAKKPLPSSLLRPITFAGFEGDILKVDSADWGPIYVVKAAFNIRKVKGGLLFREKDQRRSRYSQKKFNNVTIQIWGPSELNKNSYFSLKRQSEGKPVPKGFHSLHIRQSDGSKVNHGQFFVRASKDLQAFGKEYVALSEAIGELLQNIVEKRFVWDPDLFEKDLEAMIDIMPLHDTTPIRPFTGLVININSVTAAHKDAGDLFVISLGSYKGGKLCLYQPRLAVETRNRDIVSFKSQVNFNLHYQGDRCSVVVQTDKQGLFYSKDGNGWKDNPWVQ